MKSFTLSLGSLSRHSKMLYFLLFQLSYAILNIASLLFVLFFTVSLFKLTELAC